MSIMLVALNTLGARATSDSRTTSSGVMVAHTARFLGFQVNLKSLLALATVGLTAAPALLNPADSDFPDRQKRWPYESRSPSTTTRTISGSVVKSRAGGTRVASEVEVGRPRGGDGGPTARLR